MQCDLLRIAAVCLVAFATLLNAQEKHVLTRIALDVVAIAANLCFSWWIELCVVVVALSFLYLLNHLQMT